MSKIKFFFLPFFIILLITPVCLTNAQTLEQQPKTLGNFNAPTFLDVKVSEDDSFIIVNNGDGFVWKFAKATAGYNEIWYNDQILIHNERWVLEYYSGNWKQKGIPQYVTYEQKESYYVKVTRFYTDFLGTTFNMQYEFFGGSRTKITFIGNIGSVEEYRLLWEASGIDKTFVSSNEATKTINLWDSELETDGISFDYSDVYTSLGDITDVILDVSPNDQKITQIFKVGTLDLGTFILDPSFGYDADESTYSGFGDSTRASNYTLSEDGNVNSISFYMTSNTDATEAKVGIYDDDGASGYAGTLIGQGVGAVSGTGWQTISGLDIDLTAGVWWIAVTFDGDSWSNRVGKTDPGTTDRFVADATRTYADAMLASFPIDGTATSVLCIYANYTTSEGADSTAPTYSDLSYSTTVIGASCDFNITINDETDLTVSGSYIFSTNNTGTWTNNTAVILTSTPQTVSVSKTLNNSVGQVLGYNWFFNDTAGNWNSTGIQTLTTTSESYTVSISYTPTENIMQGERVTFSLSIVGDTTSETLTGFTANLTRDGDLFREGWNQTLFTDTVDSAQSHFYGVGGLLDSSGNNLTFSCSPVTVVWQSPSQGGSVGDVSEDPEPSDSVDPTDEPDGEEPDATTSGFSIKLNDLIAVAAIVCGSVLVATVTYDKFERKAKAEKRKPKPGTKLKKKKVSY